MYFDNDLSKTESCSPEGSALNSVSMNIRPPGSSRREPVESDENELMSGSLLNSQVSCVDNTAVGEQYGGSYPHMNISPDTDPGGRVVCVRIIPDEAEDQCCPPMEGLNSLSRVGAIRAPCSPHQTNIAVAGPDWVGARPKVPAPHPTDRYQKYTDCQAKILSSSARKYLAKSLNYRIEATSEHGYLKNWEGLAELMSKDFSYTQSLDSREKDPTGALLIDWQTERGSTIGKLVEYLYRLDRYDILDDKEFFKLIKRSVDDDIDRAKRTEDEFQRQDKRKPQTPHMTVSDVEGQTQMIYNAFVCYEEGDEGFVMEMIKELEMRDGHKLCLNARDLLIGQNVQIVTAELIKSRCEKTIVVLSKKFVREDSEMCQFAMNVSHSLNPAARKSKIVPVMAEDCEIPPSLCHITPVDFTRSLERTWQWRKVSACLKTCHELLNYTEKASLRHITLKAPYRPVDLRASVRATMNAGNAEVLAAGTVIISADTTTEKKIQDDDARRSPSLKSTSSSEGVDDVDNTDGAMGGIPKTAKPRGRDKKKKDKDMSREKKKNAKRNFHFSRFFRKE